MYSGIYISLNFRIVLSIRKEVQISITQLRKRDIQWERTSEGVVRTLLGFPYLESNLLIKSSNRPNGRGKI
jgi:hypothetical protein